MKIDYEKANNIIKGLRFVLSGEYRNTCECSTCKQMPNTISQSIHALERLRDAGEKLQEKKECITKAITKGKDEK